MDILLRMHPSALNDARVALTLSGLFSSDDVDHLLGMDRDSKEVQHAVSKAVTHALLQVGDEDRQRRSVAVIAGIAIKSGGLRCGIFAGSGDVKVHEAPLIFKTELEAMVRYTLFEMETSAIQKKSVNDLIFSLLDHTVKMDHITRQCCRLLGEEDLSRFQDPDEGNASSEDDYESDGFICSDDEGDYEDDALAGELLKVQEAEEEAEEEEEEEGIKDDKKGVSVSPLPRRVRPTAVLSQVPAPPLPASSPAPSPTPAPTPATDGSSLAKRRRKGDGGDSTSNLGSCPTFDLTHE